MNYGMKAKNPMDCVLFYKKEKPDETVLISREEVTASQMLSSKIFLYDYSNFLMQVSPVLPETFQECRIRVYVKNPKKLEAVRE